MTDQAPASGPRLSRRSFVMRGLAAIGAGIAAILALPIAGFATAPGWRARTPVRWLSTSVVPTSRSSDWTPVGRIADFEIGVPSTDWSTDTSSTVGSRRRCPSASTSFARARPRSRCSTRTARTSAVRWPGPTARASSCVRAMEDRSTATGEVVSGPPPRPMIRYETRIDGDQILIGQLVEGA